MKICLCGSTRFMDQFHDANVALSLAGHVVYSVATSTKGDFQPTADQKFMLDMVHLQKIQESEAIVVVGRQEDGSVYIGESTRKEMMFATTLGHPIVLFDLKKPIAGPWMDFSKVLTEASETDEDREEQEAENERRRAEFLGTFSSDDEDKAKEQTQN